MGKNTLTSLQCSVLEAWDSAIPRWLKLLFQLLKLVRMTDPASWIILPRAKF